MARRSPRWRAPKEGIDHAALFAEEVKRVARTSGLLTAYRRSSGMLLCAIASELARERLAEAARKCADESIRAGRNDRFSALEIAAKNARLAWTGEWWRAEPCGTEPIHLAPGDEYFRG